MSQTIWNTAHGRLFEISLDRAKDTQLIGSYLGNHVRPILLLLAPIYLLLPDPRLLLILQTMALGLGAVPLFWIAQRKLTSRYSQVGLVVGYLLYPALGYLNLFDFHPIALSIPLLFVAYWALTEERQILFWAAIVLALATKEEMVVPIAAFGFYCLFHPLWRRTGAGLLMLASLWAFASFFVVIPYHNEGRSYRFFTMWSHLLSQLPAGLRGESSPQTLSSLSADARLFLVHLFLPLCFLPLLGPGLLAVSLPSLAYLLLADDPFLHSIGYQYSAVLIPWLFLATVQGLGRLERWYRPGHVTRMARLPLGLLLGMTIGGILLFNPVLFHWQTGAFSCVTHGEHVGIALAQIPDQAGVATINSFGAHVAHRRYLMSIDTYPLPLRQDHLQHVDYVLLDLVDCRAVESSQSRDTYTDMVLQLLDTKQFGIRYWSDRILLLERGTPMDLELEQVRSYVRDLERQERPCWP